MHHQDILGRDGTIGLQLETPVPVRVLQATQRAGGMLNRALQLVQTVWTLNLSFSACLVIGGECGAVPHEVNVVQ